jgi:AbrB family looped-hinge helix DNA binding protein
VCGKFIKNLLTKLYFVVGMKIARKVGEKGQVVIPKDIREREGITPNSRILFSVEDGKTAIEKEGRKLSETLGEISDQRAESQDRGQIDGRMERAGINT